MLRFANSAFRLAGACVDCVGNRSLFYPCVLVIALLALRTFQFLLASFSCIDYVHYALLALFSTQEPCVALRALRQTGNRT